MGSVLLFISINDNSNVYISINILLLLIPFKNIYLLANIVHY